MPKQLTLMAVHAHPDDESSSTGGVFARYAEEGIETVLVTCTNGEFGDGPDHCKPGDDGHDPEAVAAVRLGELDIAVKELGIDHLEVLGYHDSGMADWEFKDHEKVFAQIPLDSVVDRLIGLFEKYQPDVVVTYADNAAYNHPDHLQAAVATIAAFERSTIPTKLYFIARRSDSWRKMREILVEKGVELPPAPPPDPEREERARAQDERITTYIDTKPWAAQKLAALTAHASQLDQSWFLKYADDMQEFMFATESFIKVEDRSGSPVPEDDLFAGLRRGGVMKFGIFYEHQLPRPWTVDSEYELLNNSLEQIELADKLGYHYAWEVEHHFLEEYSHSSAPEVFLGAASQRTKQIRLGHGIIQLTTNPPSRVAERVSTLDLLSHGRVELGIGEGSSVAELHPFDRRFRDKREVWEDAVRCLMPMFGDAPVEYHGEWHDFPLRNVVPKPRQKPHPPLWVACSQMETIQYAGHRGMGALGFSFISAEAAHAWVHAYYRSFTLDQELLCDYATNPNIAVVAPFMCCETEEEAIRRADGSTFFQFALRWYGQHGTGEPGETSLWAEYEKWRKTPGEKAGRARAMIGTPDQLRERLRKFEQSNIDQVILLNQAGRNTHSDICDSLELFADQVMGEFVERDDQHQQWKADVLGGDLVLDELDTTPYRMRPPRPPVTTT